jgi:hypothetical protein
MNFGEKIKNINNYIAIKSTKLLGTIWCVYAFIIFCILPLVAPQWQNNLLYLSNCAQLIFLPLLMCGQSLLGKTSEDRAISDHKKIIKEFNIVKEDDAKLDVILSELKDLKAKLAAIKTD